MEVFIFQVDVFFYFSGVCDVFLSNPIVAYFSGLFRVIVIANSFLLFPKNSFSGLNNDCSNLYKCELVVEQF